MFQNGNTNRSGSHVTLKNASRSVAYDRPSKRQRTEATNATLLVAQGNSFIYQPEPIVENNTISQIQTILDSRKPQFMNQNITITSTSNTISYTNIIGPTNYINFFLNSQYTSLLQCNYIAQYQPSNLSVYITGLNYNTIYNGPIIEASNNFGIRFLTLPRFRTTFPNPNININNISSNITFNSIFFSNINTQFIENNDTVSVLLNEETWPYTSFNILDNGIMSIFITNLNFNTLYSSVITATNRDLLSSTVTFPTIRTFFPPPIFPTPITFTPNITFNSILLNSITGASNITNINQYSINISPFINTITNNIILSYNDVEQPSNVNILFSNLLPLTSYSIILTASNDSGIISTTFDPITTLIAPPVFPTPVTFTSSEVRFNRISLNNITGASNISSSNEYSINVSPNTAGLNSNITLISMGSGNASNVDLSLTNLLPLCNYIIRLTANNVSGSASNTFDTITTLISPPVFPTPVTFTSSEVRFNRISLSNITGASNISSSNQYSINVSPNTVGINSNITLINMGSGNASNVDLSLTNLLPLCNYTIRLTANNVSGSASNTFTPITTLVGPLFYNNWIIKT